MAETYEERLVRLRLAFKITDVVSNPTAHEQKLFNAWKSDRLPWLGDSLFTRDKSRVALFERAFNAYVDRELQRLEETSA